MIHGLYSQRICLNFNLNQIHNYYISKGDLNISKKKLLKTRLSSTKSKFHTYYKLEDFLQFKADRL